MPQYESGLTVIIEESSNFFPSTMENDIIYGLLKTGHTWLVFLYIYSTTQKRWMVEARLQVIGFGRDLWKKEEEAFKHVKVIYKKTRKQNSSHSGKIHR